MRIQILELPQNSLGPASETPFAVVVSEIPIIIDDDPSLRSDAEAARGRWESKLLGGGAQFVLFTSESVEIGPPKPEKTQAQESKDYLLQHYSNPRGYAEGGYVNGR